jgi:hypothetical protein
MTAMFGWESLVLSSTVSASAEVSGLGAGQLQNLHGATATAWQTPVGTTTAWLLLDAGVAAVWRALGLFRTNLTPAATVRWRIGPAEALIERSADLVVTPRPGWTPPAGWALTRAGSAWGFDAAGILQSVAANTPRFAYDGAGTPLGLLVEGARTNELLHARNLSNAAWTKTNATAALTAIGITGAANSASLLTATAANATAIQPRTLGAASRVFSVFLRRVTGSGPVELTVNGGTGWTGVTITAAWARYALIVTGANPSVGIRLQTAGDVVEVDCAQLESSFNPSSPIITTTATVTRNADDVTIANAVGGAGTLGVDLAPGFGNLSFRARDAGGTNYVQIRQASAGAVLHDLQVVQGGVTVYDGPDQSPAAPAEYRMAASWSPAGATSWLAGSQTGSYAGAVALVDRVQILGVGPPAIVAALRVWTAPLTDGQAAAWTATGSTLDASALGLDTGTISAGIAAGYGQSLTLLPADLTARYGRLDIADPANPEAVLRIPQLYAGPVRIPARGVSTRASAFARRADIATPVTRGGQEFPETRFVRRGWRIALPLLSSAEVYDLVQAMLRAAEDGRNILFVPMAASPWLAREAVFGRLAEAGDVPWAEGSTILRAWSATITERL